MHAGEGPEGVVAPYLGYAPDLAGMAPGDWYVGDIVAVEAIGYETKSTVILATDLLGAVAGGYRDAGTDFFAVDVAYGEEGMLALGPPSEVAGPSLDPSKAEPPSLVPPPDTPITAAVDDYLSWYLTGAEGAYGAPRPDPSYQAVTVRAMSEPVLSRQPAPIQVEVIATDGGGRSTILGYSLVVADQQGMWIATHPEN